MRRLQVVNLIGASFVVGLALRANPHTIATSGSPLLRSVVEGDSCLRSPQRLHITIISSPSNFGRSRTLSDDTIPSLSEQALLQQGFTLTVHPDGSKSWTWPEEKPLNEEAPPYAPDHDLITYIEESREKKERRP